MHYQLAKIILDNDTQAVVVAINECLNSVTIKKYYKDDIKNLTIKVSGFLYFRKNLTDLQIQSDF